MKNALLILLFINFSCSSTHVNDTKTIEPKNINSETNIKTLRNNCIINNIALDCAKYAYRIKSTNGQAARDFYSKACSLGDRNSCFKSSQEQR